jgi:hypothetical protein
MSSEQRTPPDEPAATPAEAEEESQDRAAYLPIGIVFLVLGLGGLMNDSMRYAALAFVPVGVVFLILALQGRQDDRPAAGTEPTDPASPPDVTPR